MEYTQQYIHKMAHSVFASNFGRRKSEFLTNSKDLQHP